MQYNRYCRNSSIIVDLAMGQIPRSTERIPTLRIGLSLSASVSCLHRVKDLRLLTFIIIDEPQCALHGTIIIGVVQCLRVRICLMKVILAIMILCALTRVSGHQEVLRIGNSSLFF